jgi:hypothetical protein
MTVAIVYQRGGENGSGSELVVTVTVSVLLLLGGSGVGFLILSRTWTSMPGLSIARSIHCCNGSYGNGSIRTSVGDSCLLHIF